MGAIDDYLAELEPEPATIIGDAYSLASELVPEAEQGVSYGMAALTYLGSPLLAVKLAKTHIGLYPYSPAVITDVLGHLPPIRGLTSAKGTIRVRPDVAIPEVLVRSLVLARSIEIQAASTSRRRPRAPRATHEA